MDPLEATSLRGHFGVPGLGQMCCLEDALGRGAELVIPGNSCLSPLLSWSGFWIPLIPLPDVHHTQQVLSHPAHSQIVVWPYPFPRRLTQLRNGAPWFIVPEFFYVCLNSLPFSFLWADPHCWVLNVCSLCLLQNLGFAPTLVPLLLHWSPCSYTFRLPLLMSPP